MTIRSLAGRMHCFKPNLIATILGSLIFTNVFAEEDWLLKSQRILKNIEGHVPPVWLNANPKQAGAQQQALELMNASKAIALGANTHFLAAKTQANLDLAKPKRLVFISFALGQAVLKNIFTEASGQADVLLVFRGPRPNQKLPAFFRELKNLLKDIDPVPNIVIDPTRFAHWSINSVPEIMVEAHGKALLRVKGVSSLTWLNAKQAAGGQGDLGRLGEVYDIAEIDLLSEMKRRMAAIDWHSKQRQAIARFWSQHKFEVLPVATTNRERLIDLSLSAPRDLFAPNGTLIIAAGTTVNPLDNLAFGLCLIVFDATDPKQLAFIEQLSCQDKHARRLFLATQLPRQHGWDELKNLENTLQSPVFLLTPDVRQRFQLQKVPALVEQNSKQISIREVNMTALKAKPPL